MLRVPGSPPRPRSGISGGCPCVGSPGHRPTTREGGDSLVWWRLPRPLIATKGWVPDQSRENRGSPASLRSGFPTFLQRAGSPGIHIDAATTSLAAMAALPTPRRPAGVPDINVEGRASPHQRQFASEPRGVWVVVPLEPKGCASSLHSRHGVWELHSASAVQPRAYSHAGAFTMLNPFSNRLHPVLGI